MTMKHGQSSEIKRSSKDMFKYIELKKEKKELLSRLRTINGKLETLVKDFISIEKFKIKTNSNRCNR